MKVHFLSNFLFQVLKLVPDIRQWPTCKRWCPLWRLLMSDSYVQHVFVLFQKNCYVFLLKKNIFFFYFCFLFNEKMDFINYCYVFWQSFYYVFIKVLYPFILCSFLFKQCYVLLYTIKSVGVWGSLR